MRSDLLLFLVWILFLLGTQLLKKKKRPLKNAGIGLFLLTLLIKLS